MAQCCGPGLKGVPTAGWVLRGEPDFWVLFQQDTQIQVLLELICKRISARSCWRLAAGGATGPTWVGSVQVNTLKIHCGWVGAETTGASLIRKG